MNAHQKIIRMILSNIKIYAILFLELIICFTLIFVGVNQHISKNERVQLIENQTNQSLYLKYNGNTPLNRSDIQKLEELIPHLIYAKKFSIHFIVDHSIISVSGLLANENFQTEYLIRLKKDEVFIPSSDWLSVIKKNNPSIDQDLAFYNDYLKIEQEKLIYKFIDSFSKSIITSYHSDLDFNLDDAFVLDYHNWSEYLTSLDSSTELITIKGVTSSNEFNLNTVNQAFEGKGLFQIIPIEEQFRLGTNRLLELINILSFCSLIALLVLMIGIVGIFVIVFEKRKKSFSVCLLIGATKKALIFELLIELLVIIQSASVISFLISLPLNKYISTVYFAIETRFDTLLLMFILPIIITVPPIIYIIIKLNSSDLILNLKEM